MRGKTNLTFPEPAKIGVDLMGSDSAPEKLLEAVIATAQELKTTADIFVLGTEDIFSGYDLSHLKVIPVKEVIEMTEDPLIAIRRKKGSSISIGMRMLKNKQLDAFISGGNTGALIAGSKLYLRMLANIDRPALMTLIPTKQNPVAVLDVGANVTFKAEHLVQFAYMGIAYQKTRGIERPRLGLLNIGSEEKKGTAELREAYQKLQELNRNDPSFVFVGNVEGRDVLLGNIDVIVTDGFTGNVFLKTAEGVADFILDMLDTAILEQQYSHLKSLLVNLRHRLDYAEYPGAIVGGVEGIVIKCHGSTAAQSMTHSIKTALRLVEHDFLEKIKQLLSMEGPEAGKNLRRFSLTSLKKRLFEK